MSDRKPRISLAIITLNEANNLARCIESCRGLVDDIAIVDSGSTDGTIELARSLGARVEIHPFDNFGAQKNRALDLANGDWILNLDADEWLSDELRARIERVVVEAPEMCASIGFPRHNRICGRWPRFGGWRESGKYRLWRKGKVRWAGAVHEWAEISPGHDQTRVPEPMLHDLGDDWVRYQGKQLRYAELQASQMHARGRRSGVFAAQLHGAFAFMKSAFLQLGILDGPFGIQAAALKGRVAYTKYRTLRTLGPNPG